MNPAAVNDYLLALQDRIVSELERIDGQRFRRDRWQRSEGGGGESRIVEEGGVFERGGVNYSHVHGERLPDSASAARPELAGRAFQAMGVSLVLHPRNPFVPTVHLNVRFLVASKPGSDPAWWFGGGMDLTPYYGFEEDARHFHSTCRQALEPFGPGLYPRFKRWCDEYFYLKHRGEPRGIGGVFFANLRTQARVAGYREKRAASLYAISRELAAALKEEEIVRAAAGHIGAEFGAQCAILFPSAAGRIVYPKGESQSYSLHGADLGVAQWVFDHGRIAGRGTDTLPGGDAVYLPIQGASGPLGVLALLPSSLRRVFLPEQQRLLETFLNQVALALERVRLAEAAQSAQIKVETESLRNSLLAGISHDLRTPLASIVGAASSLAEDPERLSPESRRELARTIYDEGQRMATLANNILDMARLDAGAVKLNLDWVPLEEIVGGVLTRLRARLEGRPVRTALPGDAPLVKLDAVLIEQVLVNIVENALKYTPAGTAIEISAEFAPSLVTVTVADEGPGIPPGLEEKLFDKFYRASPERAQSGVGLGLTICRAIVEAHGGTIRAENRSPHGAAFHFTLPRDETPPALEGEETQGESS